MARSCTVCTHPKRVEIDEALANGAAYRVVASQHGLGRSAVDRHRAHIGAALVEAAARQDAADDALADDLLAQARKLNRDPRRALDEAKEGSRCKRASSSDAETCPTAKWSTRGRETSRWSPRCYCRMACGTRRGTAERAGRKLSPTHPHECRHTGTRSVILVLAA